jgi:hypothetical protein
MIKLCLLTTALFVQQGADPAACATVEPDDVRLRCYDAYFRAPKAPGEQPVAAQAPAPEPLPQGTLVLPEESTAAVPVAPSPDPHRRAPEEEFGLTQAQLEERVPVESPTRGLEQIEVRVVSVERTGSGRSLIKLENGQRWLEVEASQRRHFRPGDVIKIRKAALGSYLASGPHSGMGIRVRRID